MREREYEHGKELAALLRDPESPCAQRIEAAVGPYRYLGHGAYGAVIEIGQGRDARIGKLTAHPMEISSSLALMKMRKRPTALPEIEDVFRLSSFDYGDRHCAVKGHTPALIVREALEDVKSWLARRGVSTEEEAMERQLTFLTEALPTKDQDDPALHVDNAVMMEPRTHPEVAKIAKKLVPLAKWAIKNSVSLEDFYPENLGMRKNGQPVFRDFGLADLSHLDPDPWRGPERLPIRALRGLSEGYTHEGAARRASGTGLGLSAPALGIEL